MKTIRVYINFKNVPFKQGKEKVEVNYEINNGEIKITKSSHELDSISDAFIRDRIKQKEKGLIVVKN